MQIELAIKQKQHLTKIVFVGGEEVLLDNDIVKNYCLKPEMNLTEEELKNLKDESDYERAKSRALWYLDRSAHTEKGLYDKLVKARFPKKVSAAVIARFVELGLLDDRRYAEIYAERLMEANVSKREAVQKMLQKGVPYEIIKETLEETEADEETQIQNLLQRKYARKLNEENGVQKVYAALARKGFSFSAIKNSLKKYSEELNESSEEDWEE